VVRYLHWNRREFVPDWPGETRIVKHRAARAARGGVKSGSDSARTPVRFFRRRLTSIPRICYNIVRKIAE
jgi:hypothetical protein